jgi:hypothetical protein
MVGAAGAKFRRLDDRGRCSSGVKREDFHLVSPGPKSAQRFHNFASEKFLVFPGSDHCLCRNGPHSTTLPHRLSIGDYPVVTPKGRKGRKRCWRYAKFAVRASAPIEALGKIDA